MSKIFKCDNCGKEFPQPLDEEKYLDEHEVLRSFDLCAPCRAKLKADKEKPEGDFFESIIKAKKEK